VTKESLSNDTLASEIEWADALKKAVATVVVEVPSHRKSPHGSNEGCSFWQLHFVNVSHRQVLNGSLKF
jgi:hypothetical protein